MKFSCTKPFLLSYAFFGVSLILTVYNAFFPVFLTEKFSLAPICMANALMLMLVCAAGRLKSNKHDIKFHLLLAWILK